MKISADQMKEKVHRLGGDLCGIASIARFGDAPAGFHPQDIWKGCRSVVVYALRFPGGVLAADSPSPYTFIRNKMVMKTDEVTFKLVEELETSGIDAVPIPSSEPYDYWDAGRRHGQGILSLKHAAVRAGLGSMGRNTLLITPEFGNMVWLGATLVAEDLTPDGLSLPEGCIAGCSLCLTKCPVQALTGSSIIQERCRSFAYQYTEGGEGVIACNTCRRICPRCRG